ncbi:hypothetical protein [Microlunatus soli]|uniref:Uncharacterized protein n=1 Tax=Microlunatus soli TaxID=630515 RepID=A0A1H2A7L3_9ACTN|nr:hypothetical protein [Microlunatus soli]SDT41772.1 hypothetical protein SAMN04489812_5717 [Microlunatus soli]
MTVQDRQGRPSQGTPPQRPTPRSVDEALHWQKGRIGSAAWEGWTWKFQRLAYGFVRDDRWNTADEAFAWFCDNGSVRTGVAARGALIWFAGERGVLVRCCLGDGRVIGPGVADVVGLLTVDDQDPPLGWTEPIFPFAR